jgi:AmmeMemoRadiSam system protein B
MEMMLEPSVRHPAVAGAFYPDDPVELREMIEDYLSKSEEVKLKSRGKAKLRALIVPHAGYIYSGPIAAYGYKLLANYKETVKDVILLGPSHYAGFSGICESGFGFWETPLGRLKSASIKEKLSEADGKMIASYPQAHLPEHSLEVQLPFIQSVLKDDVTVYPLLCGDANPEMFADVLEKAVDDNTIFIVSSDLSHYLTYDKAVKTDKVANTSIPKKDIERFTEKGDACGKTPILILLNIAEKKGWKGKLLNYRNSGDTAGDKIRVVGYGCYAFYE